MNKDQRKYLTDQVRSTYNQQKEKLRDKIPSPPSLNNYLVAAFLDNSIVMKDVTKLKQRIRDRVIEMGKEDALVGEEEKTRRYNRYNIDDEEDDEDNKKYIIQIPPEDLFEYPENYLKAKEEYDTKKNKILKEIEILDAQFQTINMKLQIGSDESLKNLIAEVDNLADLSLINTQLTIQNSQKQLSETPKKQLKR